MTSQLKVVGGKTTPTQPIGSVPLVFTTHIQYAGEAASRQSKEAPSGVLGFVLVQTSVRASDREY